MSHATLPQALRTTALRAAAFAALALGTLSAQAQSLQITEWLYNSRSDEAVETLPDVPATRDLTWITYGEFGKRFFEEAVTLERISDAVEGMAGKGIKIGPIGLGPGGLAGFVAEGSVGSPTISKRNTGPWPMTLSSSSRASSSAPCASAPDAAAANPASARPRALRSDAPARPDSLVSRIGDVIDTDEICVEIGADLIAAALDPTRGLGGYAAMRMMQMRRLRMPRPMVARGEHPA